MSHKNHNYSSQCNKWQHDDGHKVHNYIIITMEHTPALSNNYLTSAIDIYMGRFSVMICTTLSNLLVATILYWTVRYQ